MTEDLNQSSCGKEGFELRDTIVKDLAIYSHNNINRRINKSGCLNEYRPDPVVMICPQGFWYCNVALSDVPEIAR